MGKRKYSDENHSSKKKVKCDENKETSNEKTIEQTINKEGSTNEDPKEIEVIGNFDIKHFRKELAAKQGQTMVLTQFLQVCLNPDKNVDYMLQYLKTGGNCHEILRQVNQENKKNLTLATPAFHLFHLIILKVQSSLPHMIPPTEEACRFFLNTFMPTVEIMISEHSGPRHRKIILKLLTSMVTLNPDLGIEVLNNAPLTPKHLQYITEKSNYKEKDNVRTAFVHFVTSFLIDGHLPLIKALLEKQGLLSLVIPGLVQDEGEPVLMFLNILEKNVVDNSFISKSLKLKTFSHQVLHNMFKIYSWKGPPEINLEIRNEIKPEIVSLLSEIMLTLFTSHRLGLYFVDNYFGTAESNKNQNLYKALLTLKRPWEDDKLCEIILEIIYKCPDLHRAIINVIEQSFEPQHSPIWERTTKFLIKLLDKFKPEYMVPRMGYMSPTQVANFVRFVALPIPLLKLIQSNLGKDITISLYCVKVLVKLLDSLQRYIQILEMQESNANVVDLKNKLDYFLPKHLPTPNALVTLVKDIINGRNKHDSCNDYRLPHINDCEALVSLLDLLLLYNATHPIFFETIEGSLDMKKILDFSTTLAVGNIALLKFKIVSLWLTLDSSAISLKNDMFKHLFLIMLEVYTSEDDETWIEAKDTLHTFFKNTAIYETDEDEIHLTLYALRNSKVHPTSIIADIIHYILEKKRDLTEFIRNQIVNFEILDESSENHLDKLFKDLMEDDCTIESAFLENKIPSPFIVGCIQYIQNNKDVKDFLSVYVANLLHQIYSPELTEILMGDSKVDARSYVASWIGQPISLNQHIVGKDETLRNLSISIIEDKDISVKVIFPFLEEINPDEQFDLKIGDTTYGINLNWKIDSSELLIWAKYLIFCMLRLSHMDLFNESHFRKITDYFECLITVSKAHHRLDICRTIIVTLFKNPHFLKIYRPLDLNKVQQSTLATKFILQITSQYKDIVTYMNKKHKLLMPFQKKNCNELVKAFIKINKKKGLDSEHTVKVLEVIGISNDDDAVIFNHIFKTDINNCVKDDKEPSLVLEVLCVLIDKYSKIVAMDLPQNVLENIMHLYTEMLTNKDINPNLTKLENTLVNYFENKPHQVKHVTEDNFKQFFFANTIRKSTYQLSSLLLKHNLKFCNTFKEQIMRSEILSQREITLPLSNAFIAHTKFVSENKDVLTTIFHEYKSNIIKLLEKPHKAGQLYITCWKFIRKVIVECMDFEDCQKIFNKVQKYEVVEVYHVELLQTTFLKLCLTTNGHKKDYLNNFILTVLNMITMALKENKDAQVIQQVAFILQSTLDICKQFDGFALDQKDDFKKILESPIWQNVCKAILKDSLKVKKIDQGLTFGPQLLHLLNSLVQYFYSSNNEDLVTLFDMITSHSEFLNVMLSHHSTDIKLRLIEFLYTLIIKNESVMKSQHVPVYLSSYHATRRPCDRLLLSILNFYETHGQPVNEYKPYIFGDSAANHYAVRKNRTSTLWGHPTPNQVFSLFEKDVIERTIRHFPVTQKLDYSYEFSNDFDLESTKCVAEYVKNENKLKTNDNESAINNILSFEKYDRILRKFGSVDLVTTSHQVPDDSIYDPAFLFPLLSHLLAPGSVASCFKLLRTGLLSLPVMGLSSHCASMRAAAYHVLHRFHLLLETETRHKNDKLLLTDFIETLRQSLSTAIVNAENENGFKNPRLPAVAALYLSKALMVSTAPFDPLYKPVNNFLIAKQFLDLTVVPDFLSLFHDSDVEAQERRLWILSIIKDGVKTMTDVNVVFKTMCLKMIMDYYSSVLSDKKTKEKILEAINSIVSVPRAFEILYEGYGLLSWLHSAVLKISKDDKSIAKGIIGILRNMLHSMSVNCFARNLSGFVKKSAVNGKHFEELSKVKVNKDLEQDILNLLHHLLHSVHILEIEDVIEYVKVYRLISKRTLKCLTQKQMVSLLSKCGVFVKDCEGLRLLSTALVSKDNIVVESKNINHLSDLNINVETRKCLLEELTCLVKRYIC